MAYHFCEEAGDTGIKFDRGSSRYFVVVLLHVDDPFPVRDAISALRERLRLPTGFEFKFHRTVPRLKMAFFEAMATVPFDIRVLVLDKKGLVKPLTRQSLYNFCLGEMFLDMPEREVACSILVLDGADESTRLQRGIRVHLSGLARQRGERSFKKVVLRDSRREPVLQCADMVCGSIYRWFARDDATFYKMIKERIVSLTMKRKLHT